MGKSFLGADHIKYLNKYITVLPDLLLMLLTLEDMVCMHFIVSDKLCTR